MKAISIQQPYAHLIMLPDDHEHAKRIENRTWHSNYVGPLLIHAGMGRKFLALSADKKRDVGYDVPLADMAFGAIIGICEMRGCVKLRPRTDYYQTPRGQWNCGAVVESEGDRNRWPWIESHQHAEGPYGFVLAECRRFETPIPYKGCLGIFDVPREIVGAMRPETPDELAARLWAESHPFGECVADEPRKDAWLTEVAALARERDELRIAATIAERLGKALMISLDSETRE